ncbi:MAG: hypothetical protein JO132_04570 [Streptosporangiaceae bacterium]|nr:hypothetical protein [Streptosporangiaceae bacterium]
MTGGFFRHRGLIAFSAGAAMAEAGVLSVLAPAARPLAPQVTALPPLAAYHDLRWAFAFNQPWLGFAAVLLLLLLVRSATDALLLLLAWPRAAPHIPRPRFGESCASWAVLTLLVWLVMSPVATLMFGVALLPFSWPFLAALPILLGTALALSQGAAGQAWWRRLPPARTAAWLLVTFAMLSAASVLMGHLDTAGAVAVAGLAGLADARAWYGLTGAAVRRAAERPPQSWHWQASLWQIRQGFRHRTGWIPVAPLAAVLVIALVVGLARMAFTGTVRLPATGGNVVAAAAAAGAGAAARSGAPAATGATAGTGSSRNRGALLLVAGWGSHCCQDADALRAQEPGMLVRQFSYSGLDAAGRPVPYGAAAGNLPIQVLGDLMAAQVDWLYGRVHQPVDVVAESEGTLGLYAMLARHPHVPVRSVVLLSPIIGPGQTGLAAGTVPGDALVTLDQLVGGMSPYGSSGARKLIDSVSEVGARYFELASRRQALPWLAVIPLADAVTLSACPLSPNVIFVAALHGGLLGDPSVRKMIVAFLSGGPTAAQHLGSQRDLRRAAQLISAAAAAWRMPDLDDGCPA